MRHTSLRCESDGVGSSLETEWAASFPREISGEETTGTSAQVLPFLQFIVYEQASRAFFAGAYNQAVPSVINGDDVIAFGAVPAGSDLDINLAPAYRQGRKDGKDKHYHTSQSMHLAFSFCSENFCRFSSQQYVKTYSISYHTVAKNPANTPNSLN
jgi:hypothetical protein